jgi:hypothetical protein
MHNNKLFIVAWFLVAYIVSASLFKLVLTLLKIVNIQHTRVVALSIGISVGYLAINFLSPLYQKEKYWLYNTICQVGFGYMFISIGYCLRIFLKVFKKITFLFVTYVAMATFVGNGTFHPLYMAWSNYPDGFLLQTTSSLLGCFGVLSVAYILSTTVNHNLLQAIGQSSKDIMTLHFTSFLVVDISLSYFGYFNIKNIDGHTHYINPSAWSIYIGAGIFIPILIRYIICVLYKYSGQFDKVFQRNKARALGRMPTPNI